MLQLLCPVAYFFSFLDNFEIAKDFWNTDYYPKKWGGIVLSSVITVLMFVRDPSRNQANHFSEH